MGTFSGPPHFLWPHQCPIHTRPLSHSQSPLSTCREASMAGLPPLWCNLGQWEIDYRKERQALALLFDGLLWVTSPSGNSCSQVMSTSQARLVSGLWLCSQLAHGSKLHDASYLSLTTPTLSSFEVPKSVLIPLTWPSGYIANSQNCAWQFLWMGYVQKWPIQILALDLDKNLVFALTFCFPPQPPLPGKHQQLEHLEAANQWH